MSAIRRARERARSEVAAAIKDEARRQLAAEGAARLSLRAVARELGMVSSALYRYYPSRDDLLTALIVDAYDALGEAAERALAESETADPLSSWTAVCRATRAWALAHPHEYALIYGSPVPGYAAPQDTIIPASRVGRALITVVRRARAARALRTTAAGPLPTGLRPQADRLAAQLAPELPSDMMPALAAAWAQLFGLISFEVFGQFTGIVDDREVFFAHAVGELARGIGLTEAAAQERGAAAPAQGDTGSTGAMPRSCDSGAFVKPVGR